MTTDTWYHTDGSLCVAGHGPDMACIEGGGTVLSAPSLLTALLGELEEKRAECERLRGALEAIYDENNLGMNAGIIAAKALKRGAWRPSVDVHADQDSRDGSCLEGAPRDAEAQS